MSRYSARIRALERKLVPGDYPLCAGCTGRGIDIITIEEGESPPPRPVCEKCGKPRLAFIVEFADEPIDTHQPDTSVTDIMPAAETAPKALIRRRRYYGPE